MGYFFGKKGWKVYDVDSVELFVSRDVLFYEDIFPYMNPNKSCENSMHMRIFDREYSAQGKEMHAHDNTNTAFDTSQSSGPDEIMQSVDGPHNHKAQTRTEHEF